MKSNIETIDGIPGEWRTVTKASEVMVGQRVRYEKSGYKSRFGYKIPHFITGIKNNKVGTKGDGWDRNIFNGYWTTVQAFFPLADKPMRKVAKVRIEITSCGLFFKVKFGKYDFWSKGFVKSKASALRGARRFCATIGYEMEVVK